MSVRNTVDPNPLNRVLEPYWFEKTIDPVSSQIWIESHQSTAICIAVLYVLATFVGQAWMRNRKPFDLRKPLIIWNAILAAFSLAGFLRTAPTFLVLLSQRGGTYRATCTTDYVFEPETFWAFVFTISKIFELIDTVFIVLRKAPLIFLHWYHHMSMVVFMFYLYPTGDPVGRWGGILNYGIHSIMYTYYALKVAKIKVPKFISMLITTLQMVQFCAALFASIFAIFTMSNGEHCALSKTTLTIQLVGGVSYLSLFANYFYQTYFKKTTKVKST